MFSLYTQIPLRVMRVITPTPPTKSKNKEIITNNIFHCTANKTRSITKIILIVNIRSSDNKFNLNTIWTSYKGWFIEMRQLTAINSSPPNTAYMCRWTGSAFGTGQATRNYLNQCWVIVNWIHGWGAVYCLVALLPTCLLIQCIWFVKILANILINCMEIW